MSAAHSERRSLRGLLIESLARRGEPVFVDGDRIAPAAAVLAAARAGALEGSSDGIGALVDVLAELWHEGAASREALTRLHPGGRGDLDPSELVQVLATGRFDRRAEFLEARAVRVDDEARYLSRLLLGARVVRLGSGPGGFATF